MARILHISDLHLASPSSGQHENEIGDYTKSGLVQPRERQTRLSLLQDTLTALGRSLTAEKQQLDAVIVTGDVALRGNAESYALLPDLLKHLGGALPVAERILVVPGNHDVLYGSLPSSAERYNAFGDAIDALGYRRAGLEGRDDLASHDPLIVDPDGAFVVVGINSANWSVALEPLPTLAAGQLADLKARGTLPKELDDAIATLRLRDAARVSREQLLAVGDALRGVRTINGRRTVVIAAMHHQMFPVSLVEEVKPFESLTNLAELRRFYADNHVDIVLHGHKHIANTYENDLIDDQTTRHRMLICSAGTVGQGVAYGAEIAKLIEIDDELPSFPRVTVTPLAAVGPAANIVRLTARSVTRRLPASDMLEGIGRMIYGKTAVEVHTRLLAHFRDVGDASTDHLTCMVENGPSALRRPSSYPTVGDPTYNEDPDAWFEGLVQWWQNGQLAEGKPFTHGQRIRAWAGQEGRDQLVDVAEALMHDSASSRGLIALFDPDRDQIAHVTTKFPAFVLAQFHLRDDILHVVGLFRKQEMRYWWPINAAELASMQSQVVDLLAKRGKLVAAGSITTFATQAKAGTATPWVAVPRIDQLVWDNPSRLWALAAAVAAVDAPRHGEALSELCSLMREWRPAEREAPDGAPAAGPGLALLHDALRELAEVFGSLTSARRPMELLELMQLTNQQYKADPGRSMPYVQWREISRGYIDEFCHILSP
jgi:3',5'-cyclic AMP phosphodiesterase CpdA